MRKLYMTQTHNILEHHATLQTRCTHVILFHTCTRQVNEKKHENARILLALRQQLSTARNRVNDGIMGIDELPWVLAHCSTSSSCGGDSSLHQAGCWLKSQKCPPHDQPQACHHTVKHDSSRLHPIACLYETHWCMMQHDERPAFRHMVCGNHSSPPGVCNIGPSLCLFCSCAAQKLLARSHSCSHRWKWYADQWGSTSGGACRKVSQYIYIYLTELISFGWEGFSS